MADRIRDRLQTQTGQVIEASIEKCSSTRKTLSRSETIVRLSRETIASSFALLSRINDAPSLMFRRRAE